MRIPNRITLSLFSATVTILLMQRGRLEGNIIHTRILKIQIEQRNNLFGNVKQFWSPDFLSISFSEPKCHHSICYYSEYYCQRYQKTCITCKVRWIVIEFSDDNSTVEQNRVAKYKQSNNKHFRYPIVK